MFYSEKENIDSVLFNGENKDLNNTIDIVKLSTLTERDITKGTTPTTLGYELLSKPTIDNIKFFKIEDIGSKNAKPKNFITKECHDKLSRSKLEKDDILFSIAGSIGKTYKVREEDLPANTNQALAIIRLKNKKQVDFYKNYIDYIVNTLTKHAKGGVISNFNLANLKNVDILSFSDEEINIISKSLNKQEGLIDSYKEKLSLLEEQEAYYQDELLSGRLRIRLTDESINYATQQGWYLNDDLVEGKEKEFEEWIGVDFHSKVEFYKEENLTKFLNNSFSNFISNNFNIVKIGDLGEIRTGNTPSKKDSSNYGDSYNWYTTPDFRTGRAFDSKLKLSDLGFSKARIANVNDILVTCIGELGQTAIVGKIGGFNQQINCITLSENYDVNYVFTLIKRHKKYIQSFSKKNVVDIINKTDFSNIEIYVPKNNKEQKMMASFFNIFNNQFQLLNEKIKVEEEKMDYLMDELLSGRIRVK